TAAVNEMFRTGAAPDELVGALTKTPAQMWEDRRKEAIAAELESDKNNKRLWSLILPYASVERYEELSSTVWNGEKAKLIAKQPEEKLNAFRVLARGGVLTQVDEMLLHAAVVAKARGYPGFQFMMLPTHPSIGWVRFGKPGDPGIEPLLFIDASAVIAELKVVIPPPDEMKARRAARASTAKGS
ncbi:MAG TPA: hypothetical protein VE567_05535, partial [Sphingomonas sp.]|nr:hypothetical protein [Sphingomonas sp.]